MVHPLHYEMKMTNNVTLSLVISVWILSIILSSSYGFALIGVNLNRCVSPYTDVHMFAPAFLAFLIIIFVMFTIYGQFLIAKHQRSRIIQEINAIAYCGNSEMQHEFAKSESKKKYEFKAAKMIGIVIMVFLVFSFPLMVGRGLKATGNNSDLTVYLMEIGVDLVFSNSGINWLIYGSKNQHFKVAFKRILRLQTKNDGTEGFSMYDNC